MTKKKHTRQPKVRARGTRKTAARSTALARRSPTTLAVLPPAPTLAVTDDLALGVLGLVEVKLTTREEAIVSEPVDPRLVRIKPTGQPYLSHPTYTKWLNRAFGRTGWALVPASKPMKSVNAELDSVTVVQSFILHIHGKPVAFANGEHEYYARNKEQTYGDALESTVASALRRCCKRLGIGLELWDRDWLDDWMRAHAVKVKVNTAKKGQPEDIKYLWRRAAAEPFWNEVGPTRSREAPRAPATPEPVVADHPDRDKPITHGTKDRPGQLERLWVIIRNSRRTDDEIRAYLKMFYNVDATALIKRRDYDTIIKAIEHPGPLLPPREPGEEG